MKQVITDSPTRVEQNTTVQQGKSVAIELANKKYPETMDEYRAIMWEQHDLFCKKMLDYGPGNISLGSDLQSPEDKKMSLTGIWFRLSDKLNRLKNLVVLGNKPNVDNESTKDTYQDISNYSIIAQIINSGKWGK